MHKSKWEGFNKRQDVGLVENFHKLSTSLDSLANSSNPSESLSDESHDSDSGADTKSKNSFAVKCEVYSQNACGSIKSWTRSETGNSENSYEYITNESADKKATANNNGEKRLDLVMARMETIPEENEPKISVKEILKRFENLKEKSGKDSGTTKDKGVKHKDKQSMKLKENQKDLPKDEFKDLKLKEISSNCSTSGCSTTSNEVKCNITFK